MVRGMHAGDRLAKMRVKNKTLAIRGTRPRAIPRFAQALSVLVFLLGWMALVTPLAAQDDAASGVELTARAGYDGYYKSDFWVPVRASVTNGGPSSEGYLQVVTGSASSNDQVVYRSPISLPTSSSKDQTLYVHIPSLANQLTVELMDSSNGVMMSAETNRLTGLSDDALLYGVVTRNPGRLAYLERVTGGRSEAAVAYLSLAEIPDTAVALSALDVIVFHDVDTGQLTAGQRDALDSWLDTGGQLVVTGGPTWQETTAGLSELLPVTVSGTQTFEDMPALREVGGQAFRDPGPYVVTDSRLQQGDVSIHEDGVPLLARRAHGRGSVFFLALDPSLAPLLDWDGNENLWAEVANYAQPLPTWAKGARNSYAAASAVSSLPASDLPGAWALFLFLMIYVAIVGPVNYFVLRRMGRRELAWVTIPLLVLLFSVTAYAVGFELKGNETIINQMSIVYGQVDGKQARVQTLIGLYSPRRAAYDMTMPAEALARPFERSFGALGGQGNVEAIERAAAVTVSGIRVDVGGVETLVADSYQPVPNVTGSVKLRPSTSDVTVDVELFNNGTVALENAVLLVGSTAISLGDLAAGSSLSHSENIASAAGSSAAGGIGSVYVPMPPTTPLMSNQAIILGSTDYYNDRQVYPRWQLLQAMAPQSRTSGSSDAKDAFTLIAWSKEPQLDLGLADREFDSIGTTLYFLELPSRQAFSEQAEMIVPRNLLSWTVLTEDGVYDARVDDLLLPEGSVEFEFVPWSDFRTLTVEEMSIILTAPAARPAQQLPRVQLWDWKEESWRVAGDPVWGRISVEDPSRYVGPGNAVRIQLVNPSQEMINIEHVYPELTGTMK